MRQNLKQNIDEKYLQTSDTMKKTLVPINLFPINPSMLTEKWAFQTYHYYSAFHIGKIADVPSLDDAQKWIHTAKDIMEQLKGIGVSKSQEKICDMMKSYFTFDRGNDQFCSFYDVIGFLSKPDFYEKNIELYRNMVHMFQYGIFRVGYNSWAIEAAQKWMEERNITFEDKNKGIRPKGKGFVYKLIVSRASNSICDRLQGITAKNHQEYILVRNKKIKKFGNKEYNCMPYVFNHRFPGYVCRLKSLDVPEDNGILTVPQRAQIEKLIRRRLNCGDTFDDILYSIRVALETRNKGNLLFCYVLY